MKFLKIALLLFALLVSGIASAQTRFLVGATSSDSFDNQSLGVIASAEVPFAKRFEFDATGTFSPIERHTALGHGTAHTTQVGGFAGITKKFGIFAVLRLGSYSVTSVSKSSYYAEPGVGFRIKLLGLPTRLGLQYIQQIHNGITNGVESNHLRGGLFSISTRIGCIGLVCIRADESVSGGVVRNQGNPQCDGEFGGIITCPRQAVVGTGITGSLRIEFPRHREIENQIF